MIVNIVKNAIISKNNKILLIQRSKSQKYNANQWTLPGGKIEKNEHKLKAVIRESIEEIGIRFNLSQLDEISFRRYKGVEANMIFETIFKTNIQKEFIPLLSNEHQDYMWLEIDNLHTINRECLTILQDILNKK